MADITNWPWAINQELPEGYGYPAEALRAQHYDATSGGTGVSSPTALKVVASDAPDNQFHVIPGGGTAVSTYAGQENQSYQGAFFRRESYELDSTGSSSGGRHDLVIQRFIDPDHEDVPGYEGEYPIPPEVAVDMKFYWIEVLQGRSSTTELPYPHVKLAHIRRGPNQTIVRPEDIVDLRKLATPKTWLHMTARNLNIAETESLHTGSKTWPTPATHTVRIPEWATRMQIQASVFMARSHASAGDAGVASGNFQLFLIHDGEEQATQQTDWRTGGDQDRERFNILLAHRLHVRKSFRGQDVRVELRARKYGGPNVYADGATSFLVQIYFEQEIA